MSMPEWFHHNGKRMKDISYDEEKRWLTVRDEEDPETKLVISAPRKPRRATLPIKLQWQVTHPQMMVTGGTMFVSVQRLCRMFDLNDVIPHPEGYGQEQYVREGPYLNMPDKNHIGTGDPNLSVLITETLQARLREILNVVLSD